ncbi:Ltp1p [Rhizophagus irregularis DAOM 197198w]|uniref:Ltp1p n=1 Tax=Rhizophagus irregularis (strain DAOM 197198w) TaxID=1432141 RepID=A0A015LS59_RHIIW|nr:Ltp1p [Rhizophagus irregularis DAOM 197198w]
MSEKINVLFVCLGNICRSPMAEAVFAHTVKKKGLESQFRIDSAGTAGFHVGASSDYRSAQTCKQYGIIIDHYARQVKYFQIYFLIFNILIYNIYILP